MSSILRFISFMIFKTFKIPFHGVSSLHVLVCKIPIYILKMRFFVTYLGTSYRKEPSLKKIIPVLLHWIRHHIFKHKSSYVSFVTEWKITKFIIRFFARWIRMMVDSTLEPLTELLFFILSIWVLVVHACVFII